ncbi:MAG: hypothetical protein LBJ39_05580, partial [Tannerellaceae bacterium]|jgi:hypothetical protein|nr:hypothetical protein [Tannerellaceae bacterium]
MSKIRVRVDKAFRVFTQSIDIAYATDKLSGNDVTAAEKIIDYINAMMDQFERAIAHRGHSTDKKDNNDDEQTHPSLPILEVSGQIVLSADHMLLVMADQPAFAATLYPVAAEGKLALYADDIEDADNFPIIQFSMDGGTPVGLIVGPPRDDLIFKSPLVSVGPCHGEVLDSDGVLLAYIPNLKWPSSTGK